MSQSEDIDKATVAIVGGGPAGLRAAEVAAESGGARVALLEAKRFVGRKFLVAGKSGLNLTNAESLPLFLDRFSDPKDRWVDLLDDFDNVAIRKWAEGLGFETFESAGGKVFPRPMKSAPLLRKWLARLQDDEERQVELRFNARLQSIEVEPSDTGPVLILDSGEKIAANAVVLAFGGASWASTGSDGSWTEILAPHGIELTPFEPANCGWEVDWPREFLELAEGQPLKNVVVSTPDNQHSRAGELSITRYGLEGGPIYHLGPVLRSMMPTPEIQIDFKPILSLEAVEEKLRSVKKNYVREAKRRLNLGDAAAALLKTHPGLGPWKDPRTLAEAIKRCPIQLSGPRPIDEAISTAGGVKWQELTTDLMLKKLPGVFIAGEMIDWEAPTGGYLLQGCFATGQRAGRGAVNYAMG